LATRIKKMVVTPSPTVPGVMDIAFTFEDTVTHDTEHAAYVGVITLDWDTPVKVGDILVGAYPDIDLPTTP
jgi:hypothetical protein